MSLKLSSKPKTSHLTIDFKVVDIIINFDLSSFTYVFFLNPYWLSNFVKLVAKLKQ
jgi:hypothetical protein